MTAIELDGTEHAALEVLRNGPFQPIGWLYTGVFERMQRRGLCKLTINGYEITPLGLRAIDEERHWIETWIFSGVISKQRG